MNLKRQTCLILAISSMIGTMTVATSNADVTKDGIQYTKRFRGTNRFGTAVEISKQNYPNGAKILIIANGMNPADALSGGPLAYKFDAPILLVSKSIDDATLNEIARLKPESVYILGGTSSVSIGIERVIKSKLSSNAKCERVRGSNRYETSMKVAELVVGKNSSKGAGFVNGIDSKFPDALSAAPLLGTKGMPLILTNGKSIPNGADKYKANKGNYIIGGSKSININELSGKRLSGSDRYNTSAVVANEAFPYSNPNVDSSCVLVDGRDYPDALTAISISKKYNAPILLVNNTVPRNIMNYITSQKRDKGYIAGGYGSVSTAVENSVSLKLIENFKKYRNYEQEKKKRLLNDLSNLMSKYDEMVAMLTRNSNNDNAISAYRNLRNDIYNNYTSKKLSDLANVKVETIEEKQKELQKKFEDITNINDEQYNKILREQIDKSREKISENGVMIPEDRMTPSQKELFKKMQKATSLLLEANKNKEKLELAYEIKNFKVSDSGNSSDSNALIKEANELLNNAKKIRTQSPEFLSKKNSLEWAIDDARRSPTSQNLQTLKDAIDDFKYICNSYQMLDERIQKVEKIISDKKSIIEYKFKSEAYKDLNSVNGDDKSLIRDKNTIEAEIVKNKELLNNFKDRNLLTTAENALSSKMVNFNNKIRNYEEIRDRLDVTLKKIEDKKLDESKVKKLKESQDAGIQKIVKDYEDNLEKAKKLTDFDLNASIYDKLRDLDKLLNNSFNQYIEKYNAVK